MIKIFAPKPLPGPLTDRILTSGNLPLERAKILAEVPKPLPYDYQGVTIEILSHRLVDDRLEVIAKAMKADVEIKVDNPLYYMNPPICAFNGTWRKEIGLAGYEIEIQNAQENPIEALKEIVGQTIALQAK